MTEQLPFFSQTISRYLEKLLMGFEFTEQLT